jgi:hypothetical protein
MLMKMTTRKLKSKMFKINLSFVENVEKDESEGKFGRRRKSWSGAPSALRTHFPGSRVHSRELPYIASVVRTSSSTQISLSHPIAQPPDTRSSVNHVSSTGTRRYFSVEGTE